MDLTHLHLILNHFPIVGTLIGSLLLLYGFIRKDRNNQQVALAVITLMAILAIPVMLTGEPAEERVEHIAGVTEAAIEAHEEAAELAIWVMEITGFIALVGLILGYLKNRIFQPVMILALILSLASFGLMARTGSLGGQIRHTELTQNPAVTASGEAGATNETTKEEGDD
jgi:uncharacterized membrane protein